MINASELNLSTKFKGTLTELQVQAYFISKRYNISVPVCEESKYDLVLDTGNQLLRIQIKTARLESLNKNSIVFNCRSTCHNTRESHKRSYSDKEIDYFATVWNDNVYLVPVNETSSQKMLHFNTNQNKRSNWNYLEDYDAEVILKSL